MVRCRTLVTCAVALIAAGCTTVGPDYTRPEVVVPPTFRGAETTAPDTGTPSFGDLAWESVFPDPELQALIRTALDQNFDLRVAAARVLQAQSQVTIAGSLPYPTVEGSASIPYTAYGGSDRPSTYPDYSVVAQAGIGAAWELDFWGRFRRLSEAAQADLLASEDARYAVISTLVAQVGQAYLNLRALDVSLELSKRTVESRQQSLELVQARLDGGVVGVLDVRQAEALLYTATRSVPEIERQIEQNENLINALLGRNPGPIARAPVVDARIMAPTLPPGLPSELLARRPDIRQAEQQLVAANAQIGVAKAQLYPTITLSGFLGAQGGNIEGTNIGPFGVFSFVPAITLPIFDMGRLQANVEFNEALALEAGLRYQQALQQAFRDVADALVDIRKRQAFRQQQELLVKSLEDASEVAVLRYEGGVSSFLEVLDTERQLFEAAIELIQARRDEAASVIQLYKALGGGWPNQAPAVAARETTAAAPTAAGAP
jgi:multidrug efflux system outer membrane protein